MKNADSIQGCVHSFNTIVNLGSNNNKNNYNNNDNILLSSIIIIIIPPPVTRMMIKIMINADFTQGCVHTFNSIINIDIGNNNNNTSNKNDDKNNDKCFEQILLRCVLTLICSNRWHHMFTQLM